VDNKTVVRGAGTSDTGCEGHKDREVATNYKGMLFLAHGALPNLLLYKNAHIHKAQLLSDERFSLVKL